jgi:type VI secretion system protein ImpA
VGLIDVEALLRPISAASPCGSDLEYDPEFLELDRLTQGKPEQQMGGAVVPAEAPDWHTALKRAVALFGKTKDLRVAVTLTRAALHTDGFAGLRDGLAVLRGLVEHRWGGCFPRLDPSDGNDPTFRSNILMGLCDPIAFTDQIRALPLVISRSFGPFGLRDLALAGGELPTAPGTKAPTGSVIEAAFAESPSAELQATLASVRAALEHLSAIETASATQAGQSRAPNFAKLSALLQQANKIVSARLQQRGPISEEPGDHPAEQATGDKPSPPVSATVASREDVVRLLDQICNYYERQEPSSPLPLLLRRCRRLVSAAFIDIIRDVAPGGLPQVETLRGKEP